MKYTTKAIPSPYSTFCQPVHTGTFLHMVWECGEVHEFWGKVASVISRLILNQLTTDPIIHLLNDDCKLELGQLGLIKLSVFGEMQQVRFPRMTSVSQEII